MELIPKQAPKIPRWLDVLFYLSIGLLIFIFIAYFSISHFLKTSQKTLEDLDASISKEVSEKATLKSKVLTARKKIDDFSVLINKHAKTSNALVFLEEQCHPSVWFRNFDLNTNEGKIVLSGEARDFEVLGQQMLILELEKSVKLAELSGISMKKEGKITFSLSLSLDPQIFK